MLIPLNPKNAIAIKLAEIKVIGVPFKLSGTSANSSLSLIPAISSNAIVKPIPAVKPFHTDSIKLKC